jgi:hypothetical protein
MPLIPLLVLGFSLRLIKRRPAVPVPVRAAVIPSGARNLPPYHQTLAAAIWQKWREVPPPSCPAVIPSGARNRSEAELGVANLPA